MRRSTLLLLLVAARVFGFTTFMFGNDRFVAPNGNDDSCGTRAHPYSTIGKALSVSSAGDVIHLLDGTYAESITINQGGTASAHLVLKSERRWGARISGTQPIVIHTKADYVDILDLEITTQYAGPESRLGIRTTGSHILLRGNYIHDIPAPASCDRGAVGIDQGGYSSSYVPTDLQVNGNIIQNIGQIGTCKGYKKKERGYGIYFAGRDSIAANNLIFNNGAYGINTWHAASHITIVNNSILHNGRSGILIGMGDAPWDTRTGCGGHSHDSSRVGNNVVYDNFENGIREYDYYGGSCVGSNNTYSNNLVFNNRLGDWRLYPGHRHTASVFADPEFVSYQPTSAFAQGDYHLQPTSPAINKGTANLAPPADLDSSPRPTATCDIGAYQSHSSGGKVGQ